MRGPPTAAQWTKRSRYCDSDKLMTFAWQTFGPLLEGRGAERVQDFAAALRVDGQDGGGGADAGDLD